MRQNIIEYNNVIILTNINQLHNKMKKILLASCLSIAGITCAQAQSILLDNPSNHGFFGVRVSGTVTCPGNVTDNGKSESWFKNGGGFDAGLVYSFPIAANFYVEPGIKLFYDTYGVKDEYLYKVNNAATDVSLNKFGMRVPVMLGYHFDFTKDFKVYVFTGPELEAGFTGKINEKLYGGRKQSSSIYNKDNKLSQQHIDVLWDFGVGLSYRKFYFGVTGAVGMIDMINSDKYKFHENRVSFTLGYNFRIKNRGAFADM